MKKQAINRDHLKFRPARIGDAEELLKLVRAYYRFDGIRFESKRVDVALRKLLRSRALGRIWIARERAKPVGYVALTFNYDVEFGGLEGIVTDLFILSEHRRQGLGQQAIAVVCEYCRARGVRTVELQVEARNIDAQKFYLELGFKSLSRLVMSKDV